MKNPLFYVSLGLIVIFSFIQTATAQKSLYKPQTHQLDLQLAGANYITDLGNLYQPLPFSVNLLNGARYTWNYSLKHALRVGVAHRQAKFESGPTSYLNLLSYESQKKDTDFSIGYLYKYHKGPYQYFLGIEAIYSLGEVVEDGTSPDFPSFHNEYIYKNYGAGGFGGVRYFLSPNISAALEAGVYYTDNKHVSGGYGEPYTRVAYNEEIGVNVAASVGIHLVKMKKRCTCPRH